MDRPTKDQSRGLWDDYASSLGLNPDDYSNKDDLIEAVDAAEESGATSDDTAPVTPPGPAPEDLAQKAEKGSYPAGYEDAKASWKKAYDHAAKHGNTVKTSIVFADGNHDTEEFGG